MNTTILLAVDYSLSDIRDQTINVKNKGVWRQYEMLGTTSLRARLLYYQLGMHVVRSFSPVYVISVDTLLHTSPLFALALQFISSTAVTPSVLLCS